MNSPHKHNAGFVKGYFNIINGAWYSLYRAGDQGLDTSNGKWATVCEKHSTICIHRTYRLADSHLSGGEYCEECQNDISAVDPTDNIPSGDYHTPNGIIGI